MTFSKLLKWWNTASLRFNEISEAAGYASQLHNPKGRPTKTLHSSSDGNEKNEQIGRSSKLHNQFSRPEISSQTQNQVLSFFQRRLLAGMSDFNSSFHCSPQWRNRYKFNMTTKRLKRTVQFRFKLFNKEEIFPIFQFR